MENKFVLLSSTLPVPDMSCVIGNCRQCSRDQSQDQVSAFLDAIGPMASECVDRSGPSDDLTTVRDAARDDVFLPSF
jgi:hypothetical protein